MWICILLVHLFAFGYVLSGQSFSQYTGTMMDMFAQHLPRVAQPRSQSASVAWPRPTVLYRDASPVGGRWDTCLVEEAREAGIHPSLLRGHG